MSFSDREVTAWGGLVVLKLMLDSMGFREAAAEGAEFPPNRIEVVRRFS